MPYTPLRINLKPAGGGLYRELDVLDLRILWLNDDQSSSILEDQTFADQISAPSVV